mmetsp:Transcript_8710/g.8246  ORF Transcript_8710/g.8246 Transcript_8710/m.8246 type:complete len:200 (-) Transcript_8710:550-1149(-)
MSKSNGSSSWVNLVQVQLEMLGRVEALTGKSFVDFININVFSAQISLLQGSWDGISWANSHNLRRYTSNSVREDSSHDWESQALGSGSSGKQNSSSTISYLGRVSSSGGSTLLKSWLELTKFGGSCSLSHSFILVDDDLSLSIIFSLDDSLNWGDLSWKSSVLLSFTSLSLGVCSKFVLLFSCDSVLLGNIFRSDTHWH